MNPPEKKSPYKLRVRLGRHCYFLSVRFDLTHLWVGLERVSKFPSPDPLHVHYTICPLPALVLGISKLRIPKEWKKIPRVRYYREEAK